MAWLLVPPELDCAGLCSVMLSGFPSRSRKTAVILLATVVVAHSQTTWCGKNYKVGSPVVDPGGEYPTPEISGPYFSFRCAPAIKPWIHDEDWMGTMLVDTENTNTGIAGAQPIRAAFDDRERFLVSFSVGGIPVGSGIVRLGLNQHIDFPLTLLPRSEPYDVTCVARRILHCDVFEATTQLLYLPANPYGGNVVKTDIATGGLLVKRGRIWEPVFPFGFYYSFDNYLATNLSIIDAAKARGFNLMHPVPTFGNLSVLEEVLDYMEESGLLLMYDMRWSYMNLTTVSEEVNRIKSRRNLLLWYTADEPDGWVNPHDAPSKAYKRVNELDGYHPVSLVLNCQNYFFTEYTHQSADIILGDPYTIGINTTWSAVYNTPCTKDYGDCGCDNCIGTPTAVDVGRRMDDYRQRLYWEGRKGVAVWNVNQAFGGESFWSRPPTGKEFILQSVIAINHGAMGIVSWIEPTTPEILGAATLLAQQLLPSITPYLIPSFYLRQTVTFTRPTTIAPNLDIGAWTLKDKGYSTTLVLVANMGSTPVTASLGGVGEFLVDVLLRSGGGVEGKEGAIIMSLDGGGAVGFILG